MNGSKRRLAVLGFVAAIALSTTGAALASGSPGSAASASSGTAATTCVAGSRACPIRISFAAGAYSGQASSVLTGIRSERWFVLGARAEQTMIVVVKGAGATRGIVYAPDGTSSGQPGGRIFDQVLTSSGDYLVKVTESPMGEAWSGRIDVVAMIY